MLSKKVFLKYADQRCKLRVRAQIKVYPPEQVMQDNMQREADWSTYKECLLKDYVNNKMKHKVVDKQRAKSSTSWTRVLVDCHVMIYKDAAKHIVGV